MFTPVDWMVHLEQSRLSLTRTGRERFEQLAHAKLKDDKRHKKAAAKPASLPVCCCESATA